MLKNEKNHAEAGKKKPDELDIFKLPDLSKKEPKLENHISNSIPLKSRIIMIIITLTITAVIFFVLQSIPSYQSQMVSYYVIIIGVGFSFLIYQRSTYDPYGGNIK
jgi:positive regulator of sigma E activity